MFPLNDDLMVMNPMVKKNTSQSEQLQVGGLIFSCSSRTATVPGIFGKTLPTVHQFTKEFCGCFPRNQSSYSQMMSKGCPITETKRIGHLGSITILRW